ncbi:hypothetical protein ASPSYDRAFT_89883 [Aspergillus sydowii CBS 593.65]|uniref:Hydrophobin n=1 Tax=Aspergillus sydowii CBS 593.65 TaxID=1036612 RepID=A0A1L9TIC9_9EURO|nr:uncharacterized protein ASPSYDRAFT_89883 [Aspergillus sydowii CBS 593.65]OJJ59169.1 hypothetical protein ASPSYDRAFT_89883 [Aspergillus sydowii CBS 593.65]
MKFLAIAALAATALAIPNGPGYGASNNDYTSQQDIDQEQTITPQSCGKAQLSCCSSEDKTTKVSPQASKDLLNLLGNDALDGLLGNYKGCAPLVDADVLNIPELLKQGQCNNNFACCNQNDSGDINQQGLVNAAIPCIPVKVL